MSRELSGSVVIRWAVFKESVLLRKANRFIFQDLHFYSCGVLGAKLMKTNKKITQNQHLS